VVEDEGEGGGKKKAGGPSTIVLSVEETNPTGKEKRAKPVARSRCRKKSRIFQPAEEGKKGKGTWHFNNTIQPEARKGNKAAE